MGRTSKLTNEQLAYAELCEVEVRKAQSKYGRAAVAHKLGITMSCLSKYLSGETRTVDQVRATKMPKDKRHTPIGYHGMRQQRCTLGAFDGTGEGFNGHTNRGQE